MIKEFPVSNTIVNYTSVVTFDGLFNIVIFRKVMDIKVAHEGFKVSGIGCRKLYGLLYAKSAFTYRYANSVTTWCSFIRHCKHVCNLCWSCLPFIQSHHIANHFKFYT